MAKETKLAAAQDGGTANVLGDIPLVSEEEAVEAGFVPKHIQLHLKRSEGLTLKRVMMACSSRGVQLSDGSVVNSYAKAARFILEEVGKK